MADDSATVTIEFTRDDLQSLAGLITAGAKSPNTGSMAIIQAAALLMKLDAAAKQPPKEAKSGE